MDKRGAYYAALNSMFESAGWKVLEEDMLEQIEHAKDGAFAAPDMHALGRLRGRAEAFTEIRALPAIIAMNLREQEELDEANAHI